MILVFALSLLFLLSGCQSDGLAARGDELLKTETSAAQHLSADDLLVVDCLLPGQVRKLGRQMTYLAPRRPVRTTVQDCEIRGGEYVAYDRGNYATALKVWLLQAQEGDKAAQTYVGEIYEKGLGVAPDYAAAASWYQKAAGQGHAPAQINLGHLYEKGLGVEKDPVKALDWYRKASGLKDAVALDPATMEPGEREELARLRREVERGRRESEALQQQLERTRQELEKARKELDQRRDESGVERQRLEAARDELERERKKAEERRDSAEATRLREQLKQREADVAQRSREMAHLNQRIARLEEEAERYNQQLKTLKKRQEAEPVLAGPSIEIINPPLVATRGVSIVKVPLDREAKYIIVGRITAPAGLLTLTVNEREEKVEHNGLFKTHVPVKRSGDPVKIVAIDNQGKQAAVEFQLSAKDVQPPSPPPQPSLNFGSYYALVIGNKDYLHWPALTTPVADARKTAEVLETKYGFKTRLLVNATQYDILRALNELRKELTEGDNLLVYYAGHGFLEEKIGRGYWIPVDGEQDSNAKWISTFAITDILSIMSARHVLVVADSCYSGAMSRSAFARLESGISDDARYERIKAMLQKRSRHVLTSGDLQPVLDAGGGGHSVFARAFLDVLRENRGIVEGYDLYKAVSARVVFNTSELAERQEPQYSPIRFAGHESGDFFFRPGD